jgi:hypothetical protein
VLIRQAGIVPEIVFAKDQPQYRQLPAVRLDDGTVISRWTLTWRERLRVLWTGSLWLSCLTFNHPLQPTRLETAEPVLAFTESPAEARQEQE